MRRIRTASVAALLVGALLTVPVATAAAAKKPVVDTSAILRLGADISAASFDPALIGNAGASDGANFYMPYLYDAMLRVDAQGNLQPGLAAKWSTPDPNTVLLTIRSGVKFQDGTAFTVQAVKEAWDRIRTTPASTAPHEDLWSHVTSIDIVGSDQIKVTLDVPSSGSFLTKVLAAAGGGSSVPSPTAYAKYGSDYKNHPVGAGPYAFDSFQTGQKLSLRKWNGYWDKKSQRLGGLDVLQTATGAPTVASLQAGQIDLGRISVTDAAGVQGQSNLAVSAFNNTTNSLYLLPCTNKAPFNNADARAAVSTAIDRQAVNEAAYNGSGSPAETLFPDGTIFHVPEFEGQHAYNVKKAKKLAEKGGIQPGTQIKLMVPVSTVGGDRAAVVVQDALSKIGLNAQITVSSNFIGDQQRLNPDLILVATDSSSVSSFLTTTGVPNWCKYSNPAVDSAFGTILSNADGAPASKAAWRTVQDVIANDSVFMVLTRAPILWAHTKEVHGFEVTPNIRNIPIVWNIFMTESG